MTHICYEEVLSDFFWSYPKDQKVALNSFKEIFYRVTLYIDFEHRELGAEKKSDVNRVILKSTTW